MARRFWRRRQEEIRTHDMAGWGEAKLIAWKFNPRQYPGDLTELETDVKAAGATFLHRSRELAEIIGRRGLLSLMSREWDLGFTPYENVPSTEADHKLSRVYRCVWCGKNFKGVPLWREKRHHENLFCAKREELTYDALVARTSKLHNTRVGESEEGIKLFQVPSGGVVLEEWVGPVELEPELGVMHIHKDGIPGALGLTLEELTKRWKTVKSLHVQTSSDCVILKGPVATLTKIQKKTWRLQAPKVIQRASSTATLQRTGSSLQIEGVRGRRSSSSRLPMGDDTSYLALRTQPSRRRGRKLLAVEVRTKDSERLKLGEEVDSAGEEEDMSNQPPPVTPPSKGIGTSEAVILPGTSTRTPARTWDLEVGLQPEEDTSDNDTGLLFHEDWLLSEEDTDRAASQKPNERVLEQMCKEIQNDYETEYDEDLLTPPAGVPQVGEPGYLPPSKRKHSRTRLVYSSKILELPDYEDQTQGQILTRAKERISSSRNSASRRKLEAEKLGALEERGELTYLPLVFPADTGSDALEETFITSQENALLEQEAEATWEARAAREELAAANEVIPSRINEVQIDTGVRATDLTSPGPRPSTGMTTKEEAYRRRSQRQANAPSQSRGETLPDASSCSAPIVIRTGLITKEEARRRFQERKREAQIEAAAREGFNLRSATAPVSHETRQRALSSTARHHVEDLDRSSNHHGGEHDVVSEEEEDEEEEGSGALAAGGTLATRDSTKGHGRPFPIKRKRRALSSVAPEQDETSARPALAGSSSSSTTTTVVASSEEALSRDPALQEEMNALWGIDTSVKRRRTRRQPTPEEKQAAAALELWKKKENVKIDEMRKRKAEQEKETRRLRREEVKLQSKAVKDITFKQLQVQASRLSLPPSRKRRRLRRSASGEYRGKQEDSLRNNDAPQASGDTDRGTFNSTGSSSSLGRPTVGHLPISRVNVDSVSRGTATNDTESLGSRANAPSSSRHHEGNQTTEPVRETRATSALTSATRVAQVLRPVFRHALGSPSGPRKRQLVEWLSSRKSTRLAGAALRQATPD